MPAVEVRTETIHRSRDATRLLAQSIGVLIFELERKSAGKAAAESELHLIRNRVAARFTVGDGAKRLIWAPRLDLSRRGYWVIDVDVAVEVGALAPDVGDAYGGRAKN